MSQLQLLFFGVSGSKADLTPFRIGMLCFTPLVGESESTNIDTRLLQLLIGERFGSEKAS